MRHAAQIVFVQVTDHKWTGHLLNSNAVDIHYGKPSTMRCVITEEVDGGHAYLMTQGSQVGGRRYSIHDNVTAAQEAAIRWCGRRFKVEA